MLQTTLPDRAVVRLSGDDVRGFLQGLVTSDVAGPLPVWTALLSAQGKCLFDFIVWADDPSTGSGQADVLIDCEEAAADELIKRLKMYRLRRAIEIARDETLVVWWSPDGDDGVPDPRLAALGRRGLTLRASGLPPAREHDWLKHRLVARGVRGACRAGRSAVARVQCR